MTLLPLVVVVLVAFGLVYILRDVMRWLDGM